MTYLKTFTKLVLFCALISACSNGEESTDSGTAADTSTGDSGNLSDSVAADSAQANGPYYMLALHCEPYRKQEDIVAGYAVLQSLISKADEYGIKLTMMFGVSWVDYIVSDAGRKAEVEQWKQNGHEISSHRHSVVHGSPDGYSYKSEAEYKAALGAKAELYTYKGTLDDWAKEMQRLDPALDSSCSNDEFDKNVVPKIIVKDTCSGFINRGESWEKEGDGEPEKGINEFIMVGTLNDGVERRWIGHSMIGHDKFQPQAKAAFQSMSSGAYGAVAHSQEIEKAQILAWLEFLHQEDPSGERSRTLSEIIDGQLLPEKEIASETLNAPGGPDIDKGK